MCNCQFTTLTILDYYGASGEWAEKCCDVFFLLERCEDPVVAQVLHGVPSPPVCVQFLQASIEIHQEDLQAKSGHTVITRVQHHFRLA